MLEKRAETPVEMRSYGTYYLIFSGLLILGTLWAVVDEVQIRRPWKDYQNKYYQLASSKLDSLKEAALAGIDSSQAAALKQSLDSSESGLKSAEFVDAAVQKEKLLKQLDAVTTNWRFARSRSDAAYYQYQRIKLDEGREDPKFRKEVDDDDSTAARYFADIGVVNSKIAILDETISKYTDANKKAQKAY